MPRKAPAAAKPPAKVVGVADALDLLERRRRTSTKKSPSKRGDLDLNTIR